MEAVVSMPGSFSVDAEKLAPGIWVYHNALPAEMNIVNRVESGLSKPGTRFAWSPANLNFGHHDVAIRNCFDFMYNFESFFY